MEDAASDRTVQEAGNWERCFSARVLHSGVCDGCGYPALLEHTGIVFASSGRWPLCILERLVGCCVMQPESLSAFGWGLVLLGPVMTVVESQLSHCFSISSDRVDAFDRLRNVWLAVRVSKQGRQQQHSAAVLALVESGRCWGSSRQALVRNNSAAEHARSLRSFKQWESQHRREACLRDDRQG